MPRFALVGASGFIAPRHLKAIHDTGNVLVAATDPHDSVGILDRYFPSARYFPEIERFDRHLEKLRLSDDAVDYLTVCSPNYLHDAHVRLGLRLGARVICEKPLVLNPWNLDQLAAVEQRTNGKIFTVLQLRFHPAVVALKAHHAERPRRKHEVTLSYITPRGSWYLSSWKGVVQKSGGLATNIGIHLFDLLFWLFGREQRSELHLSEPHRMGGVLEFDDAVVRWFLSVDANDLPRDHDQPAGKASRSILIDGVETEFSEGFTDLHTDVYENILAGRGHGIDDARPSIELVSRLRTLNVAPPSHEAHPAVVRALSR